MNKEMIIKKKTLYALVGGCAVGLFFVFNLVRHVGATESGGADVYRSLKNFTDVLALVQTNYVEEVEMPKLVEGAIRGMLMTLDPHSSYLNDEVYNELQVETKGKFGGLGIEITIKDGLLTVVAPIEDSPAARAGVLAGDKIIKIGDEFTKDLSLVDAVKKMRGLKGTPITISVAREGEKELVPITVVRDIIKVMSVRSRMLDEGFGYVRLAQFQERSAEEVADAIEELTKQTKDKKLNGLVLDLRNNPGGLLTQAVRVADLFLDSGIVVYTDGRLESQKQKYYAHKDDTEPDFPMIILVNGGSASASEIVSGALQDHQRAVILGTQTFGKGSVQTILPMDNGSALRLTTALYFTKSGRSIQAQGVTPDIIISEKRFPSDSEELLEEDEAKSGVRKESELPRAFKNPNSEKASAEEEEPLKIGSRSAMQADLKLLLHDDPQLDQALRLLKTWRVFKGRPAIQAKNDSAGSAAS